MYRAKGQSAAQFDRGLFVFALDAQHDGQAEISFDEIWLKPNGFAKRRDRLSTVYIAQTQAEVKPGFGKIRLRLNSGTKRTLRVGGASACQLDDAQLHLRFDRSRGQLDGPL